MHIADQVRWIVSRSGLRPSHAQSGFDTCRPDFNRAARGQFPYPEKSANTAGYRLERDAVMVDGERQLAVRLVWQPEGDRVQYTLERDAFRWNDARAALEHAGFRIINHPRYPYDLVVAPPLEVS